MRVGGWVCGWVGMRVGMSRRGGYEDRWVGMRVGMSRRGGYEGRWVGMWVGECTLVAPPPTLLILC